METSEVYVPTTQMMPAEPSPTAQRSLEYSCSDADWRDAMGAEGDACADRPGRSAVSVRPSRSTRRRRPPLADSRRLARCILVRSAVRPVPLV
ncbi:hypothetical protein ACIGKR_31955 [Rhodococcus qingshengii]|uniref:hypothetical protein n=1 Tax=Rhodococcus qingshengii TaxID=334542 RepID=UPI0037C6E450